MAQPDYDEDQSDDEGGKVDHRQVLVHQDVDDEAVEVDQVCHQQQSPERLECC